MTTRRKVTHVTMIFDDGKRETHLVDGQYAVRINRKSRYRKDDPAAEWDEHEVYWSSDHRPGPKQGTGVQS